MAATTLNGVLLTGNHGARPTATTVSKGTLYACSTHSLVYQSDASSWTTWLTATGTGLSDPMTTRGDMIYRNASNVTDRLALPSVAGQVIGRTGSDIASFYPPGFEFDYVQITSDVSATTTITTCITGGSVAYDGSTRVKIEVYCPRLIAASTAGAIIGVILFDGATELGIMATQRTPAASSNAHAGTWTRFITPTNASHQYIAKAQTSTGSGVFSAGSGAAGNDMPAFIRVTKA